MATRKSTSAPAAQRVHVALPSTISGSADVAWPGQASGAGSRNAALRSQLTEEVSAMEFGSTRSYDIAGEKEQAAFLNLFRSVVDNVHAGKGWGVQAVRRETDVVVRIGNKVTRQRNK